MLVKDLLPFLSTDQLLRIDLDIAKILAKPGQYPQSFIDDAQSVHEFIDALLDVAEDHGSTVTEVYEDALRSEVEHHQFMVTYYNDLLGIESNGRKVKHLTVIK